MAGKKKVNSTKLSARMAKMDEKGQNKLYKGDKTGTFRESGGNKKGGK